MSELVSQWSTFKLQIGVEEYKEEEVQTGVEECKVEQVEEIPDIVEEVLAHVQACGTELGGVLRKAQKHINCSGVLKAQKDQAMKQARHWQAACQKDMAKHMKLLENYDKLMEREQ